MRRIRETLRLHLEAGLSSGDALPLLVELQQPVLERGAAKVKGPTGSVAMRFQLLGAYKVAARQQLPGGDPALTQTGSSVVFPYSKANG